MTISYPNQSLKMGNVITFENRPKMFMRFLTWVKIIKPKPLKKFVVSWISPCGQFGIEDDNC